MNEILRAAALPLTNVSVAFALIVFWLLLSLASAAGILGIWLLILIVPALFRYLTNLVETVGRGRQPEPPGAEFFRWIGDYWSLFPAVVVVLLTWASYSVYFAFGERAVIALIVFAGTFYPALLGVLSITHSPLQSVNPIAMFNLVTRVGPVYLLAPSYLALLVWLSTVLSPMTGFLGLALEIMMVFSLHAVIGAIIAPYDLFDDVRIPEAAERSPEALQRDVELLRNKVITHAYGFLSRGNRDGGFTHVLQSIQDDPDPVAAWGWYFERMLAWENKVYALFFAQHYIHDMLRHGEEVPALKLIMRCRMIDDTFKPLPDDMPRARLAAESHGNIELAAVLKRV